jgi:hypothetical protein
LDWLNRKSYLITTVQDDDEKSSDEEDSPGSLVDFVVPDSDMETELSAPHTHDTILNKRIEDAIVALHALRDCLQDFQEHPSSMDIPRDN